MTDCKECIDTMTAKDGICYWCDGKCTASADYYSGCSSSFKNCNAPAIPTTTPTNLPTTPTNPPPTTTNPPPTNCPICATCPKLTRLKDNTYISAQ